MTARLIGRTDHKKASLCLSQADGGQKVRPLLEQELEAELTFN